MGPGKGLVLFLYGVRPRTRYIDPAKWNPCAAVAAVWK